MCGHTLNKWSVFSDLQDARHIRYLSASEDGRNVAFPLWFLPARQTNKCQSSLEPMSRSMSVPEHCGFLIAALADSDCCRFCWFNLKTVH